jgi:hypothetical protein
MEQTEPSFLTRGAMTVCKSCPVREDCETYAHAVPGMWGVWGGKLFRNGKVVA